MLESEIKSESTKILQSWGYIVMHLIQCNLNGSPDTMILRQGQAVFIEFKRPGNSPRDLQEYRIKKLKEHGFNTLIVRSINDLEKLR